MEFGVLKSFQGYFLGETGERRMFSNKYVMKMYTSVKWEMDISAAFSACHFKHGFAEVD